LLKEVLKEALKEVPKEALKRVVRVSALRKALPSSAALAMILSLTAAPMFAQQSNVSSSHTSPASNSAATSRPPSHTDYSEQPLVIEHYATTVRFENDGTGQRDIAARIRIQSDAGAQQLSDLVFSYNALNERVEVRYARVRKSGGNIVTADSNAIRDIPIALAHDAPAFANCKELHIDLPMLAAGDIIEYEVVTHIFKPAAPGEFWFEHRFIDKAITLDETLEIDIPQNRAVKFALAKVALPKQLAAGRAVYRWKHSNLSLAPDDNSPGSQSSSPETSAPQAPPSKAKSAAAAAKPPDILLTTFASWSEVARWYVINERAAGDASPEMRAKVQQLIAGRASDTGKIQALYNYVAQNIRYIDVPLGAAGYAPHAAAAVFANRYGDSQDEHALLAAMLRAANIDPHIEVDAALIPSARDLDPAIPAPSQFDRVLTAVALGNQLLWMDTSEQVAPFRMLAAPLRGKSALLVLPAAPNGRVTGQPLAQPAGKLVDTPADPPFPSTQRVEVSGAVNELGKLTAQAHYSLRGDTELLLRIAFHQSPPAEWNQLAQTILTLDGIRGNVTAVHPSDPAATDAPFELAVDFNQPAFLDWSAPHSKAALPLLAIGLPDPPDDKSKPIEIGSPLTVSVQLNLALPPSFTARPPVAVSVDRDYAAFKSEYRFAGNTVTAARSIDFQMRELLPARLSDYQAFSRAVAADENQPLIVDHPSSSAPGESVEGAAAVPASASVDDLLDTGNALLHSGNVASALPLLKRAVDLAPTHATAWNDLGLAYLQAAQYPAAASAFRKQLEINPADPQANDYLGLALERDQQYDDAIAAFRKQIALNALDPASHAALGNIFFEQHRFPEAIRELEKATILAPKNAPLEFTLARSYLETGANDNAVAAFEKSAALSPTPAMSNDIARNLADAGLALDKAQSYAESAVSAAAASLEHVNLSDSAPNTSRDDTTRRALRDTSILGAYWDTLGWVYFRKGQPAKAEKFIEAAWLLDETGDIGDHLGQIAEKRGNKNSAIHLYALALAAPHPNPDTRARLTLLLGSNLQIDDLAAKARPELAAIETLSAGKAAKPLAQNASAEFLVRLAPSGKTSVHAVESTGTKTEEKSSAEKTAATAASGPRGAARAVEVRFISGSDDLKPFAERLRALDYGAFFPDSAPLVPQSLVRRGMLSCYASSGECSFLLLPGSEATPPE
jgi:tetratricopeptide (TPR) repeat protein